MMANPSLLSSLPSLFCSRTLRLLVRLRAPVDTASLAQAVWSIGSVTAGTGGTLSGSQRVTALGLNALPAHTGFPVSGLKTCKKHIFNQGLVISNTVNSFETHTWTVFSVSHLLRGLRVS